MYSETTRTCPRCGRTYAAGTYRQHRKTHELAPLAKAQSDQPQWKPARNARIIAAVIGPPRRSMEDVGRDHHITRERVRQLMAKAGIDTKSLPPVERPEPPVKMVPCLVCGDEYVDGTYDAHWRQKGHLRQYVPKKYTQGEGMKARELLGKGLSHNEVAVRLGMPLGTLHLALRDAGHVGYGWHPSKVERNLTIVHRYLVERQSAPSIAADMGIDRSMVFNIIRAWRALGERMLPRPNARRDACRRGVATRQAQRARA